MPSLATRLSRLPPILTSSLLALLIDSCSNVIAQHIRHYKQSSTIKKPTPFVFDRILFTQYVVMVIICAPLNYLWQAWLERTFPGWTVASRDAKGMELVSREQRRGIDERLLEAGQGSVNGIPKVRRWDNIAKKWFTDCIVFGALFNTLAFLILMGIMKGKSVEQIVLDVRNETLGIIWNSYKVWPIANFISTTYVPVERRIVFLSGCGLIWNIYMSLVAARL